MSTAAARAPQHPLPARLPLGRREAPRRRLAVPVNVTVLRSGVPDAVPGRSVDVCEGGVGAILAAELYPGEVVGVEFELPHTGSVLAKARVCYQERLRCGLQFLSIPPAQRSMIEFWAQQDQGTQRTQVEEVADPVPVHPLDQTPMLTVPMFTGIYSQAPSEVKTPRYPSRKIRMLIVASVIAAVGMGWWRWEQGWQELESRLPGRGAEAARPRVTVPEEVMRRLLIHRVDPVYPEGSGRTRPTGVAVLDAVVGSDGSVVSLRPVSGPDVLARAAMDSVQWWKFEPYRLNGEPVEVQTTVVVVFR
jgi:hypothetical protein